MSAQKSIPVAIPEEILLCSTRYPRRVWSFVITSVLFILILLVFVFLLYFGHSFGTIHVGFDLKDPTINMPHLKNTLNGMVNVFITIVITAAAIVWMNVSKRYQYGTETCVRKTLLQIYFMFFGVVAVNLITNFVKHYYGEPRPHFISACQPDPDIVAKVMATGSSYVSPNISKIICTAITKNLDYRWSFPSGHSSQAAYTMLMTILALQNTKIPSEFVAIQALLQLAAASFATFVGFSRIADYHHHWWDVLAGAILGGSISAFVWYGYIKKRTFSVPKEDSIVINKEEESLPTIA